MVGGNGVRTAGPLNDAQSFSRQVSLRSARSCDACRVRKVKCTWAQTVGKTGSGNSQSSASRPCQACQRRDFPCTFNYRPRPRGPKNRTVERMLAFYGTPTQHTITSDDDDTDNVLATVQSESSDALQDSTVVTDAHSARNRSYPNPIEKIMTRSELHDILDRFFGYLYALTPCIHRPLLIADLHARREERDGEEEWTAMVLMLVGSTLVQIPWMFPGMPRLKVRRMAEQCYETAKKGLLKDFEEASVWRCVTLYLTSIVTAALGKRGMSELYLGANWGLVYTLRMHKEASYIGLDPIEAEMRRRIFWLALGADKTQNVIQDTPGYINSNHFIDVQLPSGILDEFAGPTPGDRTFDRTSLITGFCLVSELFRIIGKLVDLRRLDRRNAPAGLVLQSRLNEVEELLRLIVSLTDDCPPELKLVYSPAGDLPGLPRDAFMNSHTAMPSNLQGFAEDLTTQLDSLYDGFLVQQANIYVTQSMARCLAVAYRDDLLILQRKHVQAELDLDIHDTTTGHKPGPDQHGVRSQVEKQEVAQDLINILSIIPTKILAVSNAGFGDKVRYIAATQLDILSECSEVCDERWNLNEEEQLAQRREAAQMYLVNFLKILTEIEALTSLDTLTSSSPS